MYENIPARKSKYIVLTYDLILPLLIILGVVIGGWVLLASPVFSLTDIKCSLDYQPCPEGAVMAELNKSKGLNLLRLDTDRVGSRLTSGDFTVREAIFHKKFPSTLVVELQSIYPVAATRVEGVTAEWLIFDKLHRVIGLTRTDPNVPTVILKAAPVLRVGEQINSSELVQALELAVAISQELPGVKSTSLEGETVFITLTTGQTAILSTAKDRTLQIRTLQAILLDTTMSSEARIIDVRFSKPVLKSN